MQYYPPNPKNYNTTLISSLYKDIYKKLKWDSSYKVEMDNLEESERAVELIKGWMDRGAYVFCHFTADYSKLVIFRNTTTDQYIKELTQEKKDAKKEKQV